MVGVAAVAVVLLAWAVPETVRFVPHAPSAFWSIAVLGVLIDLPLFALAPRLSHPPRTTLSVCFTFAIFLLWGAGPAIIVQTIAAVVAGLTQRRSVRSVVYLTSRLLWALAVAEVAVSVTHARPLTDPGTGLTGDDVVGFLLPAVVWFVVSFGLLVLLRTVVYGEGLGRAVLELREDVFATAASMLLVSPLLTTMEGWWSALVAVPLFAWNQLSREYARHEQRLRREPVTGVLNRRGLIIGLEALVGEDEAAIGRRRPFAIVLLNLESALRVNRYLGRDVYERLLSEAAHRLIAVYGRDWVGRLSGEGFVILLPGMAEDEAVAHAAHGVAAVADPIEVNEIPFVLDPAAGVALSPEHGRDFGTLVAKAELAVGEARRLGVPAMAYVPRAEEASRRRIMLLSELHSALEDPGRRHEVAVLYQPQVDVRTGRLSGAEALFRWTHPDWGLVPTEELIEAVEPSEVIHLLTRHVLTEVATQVRAWNERGLRVRVAVNVSVQDLHEPDFPDQILQTLLVHGVPPEQLTIEITESMLIDNMERVARAARAIAKLGVGISLDDFGTGYASMQQLRALPLTEVKIDRSYVTGLTEQPAERAIVTSVHQLAEALKLSMVAEGVEDERTAQALADLPGTIGQGWYFGRPVPGQAFEERWQTTAPRARG